MKGGIVFCFALMLGGVSFAREAVAGGLTNYWEYINYPEPKAGEPRFLITSSVQYDQTASGLRLDIMDLPAGLPFVEDSPIEARLFRASGESVQPTKEGAEGLKARIGINGNTQVITYFPWGANRLEESWIEVSMESERYWIEIPYGLDRDPTQPPPASNSNGAPKYVFAMHALTEHDHVMRWKNVVYVVESHENREVSLQPANPFDAECEVVDYTVDHAQNVDEPRDTARIVDADGSTVKGWRFNIHVNDDHMRRIDTFAFGRYGDDLRTWGAIEASVGEKRYRISVPSSLFKYCHGHAHEPTAIDFLGHLRIGMTREEMDGLSPNYGCARASATPREVRYVCTASGEEISAQFDDAGKLAHWKLRRQEDLK